MSFIAFLRKKRDQALLNKLAEELNNPESEISERVNMKVDFLVNLKMIRWLDQMKIRHCSLCADTDTLRRVGPEFYCAKHKEGVPNA